MAKSSKFSHKTRKNRHMTKNQRKQAFTGVKSGPTRTERTTNLTAEEYRTKYLIGSNASHSRLMHYIRLRRRESA